MVANTTKERKQSCDRPYLKEEINTEHMLGFHKNQHLVKLSTDADLNSEPAFIPLKS